MAATTPDLAPAAPWTAGRIADFLARAFVHPDQVVELRALNVGQPRRTVAGWFDGRHLLDLARTALAITRQASGVYFTPNPVHPALLDRCANKTDVVSRDKWKTTTDDDILERRYLFVDLDPDRADGNNGQPSTADELRDAMDAADVTAADFAHYDGWPSPLRMLSGNGVHLLFPLATPIPAKVSEYERDPLREYLEVCREWHFRGVVRIDPNTHNAVRMLKVPGTRAVKGMESPHRPYRTADVLRIPDDWPAAPRCPVAPDPAPVVERGGEPGADRRAEPPREAADTPRPDRPAAPTPHSPPRRPRRDRSRAEGRGLFG